MINLNHFPFYQAVPTYTRLEARNLLSAPFKCLMFKRFLVLISYTMACVVNCKNESKSKWSEKECAQLAYIIQVKLSNLSLFFTCYLFPYCTSFSYADYDPNSRLTIRIFKNTSTLTFTITKKKSNVELIQPSNPHNKMR